MTTLSEKINKFEFEARIFVSLSIVLVITFVSFIVLANRPINFVIIGRIFGLDDNISMRYGYLLIAVLIFIATILRMWSGSLLSSKRVMAFKVQTDVLIKTGPYILSRNPIYLSDIISISGFSFCLSPVGLIMPVLFYIHYSQIIKYEEKSLRGNFGKYYVEYFEKIPRLLPTLKSIINFVPEIKNVEITKDGFRHNALYILFIPGLIVSTCTLEFYYTLIIGIPALIDWTIIHTKIGLK